MQVFKDFYIVGIDHGYGNIKTANSVTATGINVYETEPVFGGNVLSYNGRYYRFGEGHKMFIQDKTEDEDFYAATLMGIAKEFSIARISGGNVYLAAGVPLTWTTSQREPFRNYLMKNNTVSFGFDKKNYSVRFVGCDIYPQGYSAVVDRLHYMTGVNMIADIGNGTVNIMYINNRNPVESKCYTEKLGVNQCVIAAQNAVTDLCGTKIDETIIETVIRFGKADIDKKILDCITDVVRRYADRIIDVLKKYEYNPAFVKLYITGGGVSIMKNFSALGENRTVFVDDICSAAKGYETICLKRLLKESAGK